MKKRILSMVLVLCMVVGMLPTTALGFDLSAFSVFETEIETQVITPEQLTTTATDENSEEYDTETLGDSDIAIIAATSFESGDGTFGNPFVIANAKQLEYFKDTVNDGKDYDGEYIIIAENAINLYLGEPIGRYGSESYSNKQAFLGTFDGNNKTIIIPTNFDNDTITDLAVFANVGAGAVIQNLNVNYKAYVLPGYNSTHDFEGLEYGIKGGEKAGTFPTTGTVGSRDYFLDLDIDPVGGNSSVEFVIGGIAAYNAGAIINCHNLGADVEVRSEAYRTVIVTNSEVVHTPQELYTAAEAAADLTGTIVEGAVKVVGKYYPAYDVKYYNATSTAGGVVGINASTGLILNCSNEATIKTEASALAGTIDAYTCTRGQMLDSPTQALLTDIAVLSYSLGASGYARAYSGGIAGQNSGKIINSFNTGIVTSATENTDGSVTNIQNSLAHAGGIAGINTSTGTIENTYSSSNRVSATADGYYIDDSTTTSENKTTSVAYGGGVVGLQSGTCKYSYWIEDTAYETNNSAAITGGYVETNIYSSTSGSGSVDSTCSSMDTAGRLAEGYREGSTYMNLQLQAWVSKNDSGTSPYSDHVGNGYEDLYQWSDDTFPTLMKRMTVESIVDGVARPITYVVGTTGSLDISFTTAKDDTYTSTLTNTINSDGLVDIGIIGGVEYTVTFDSRLTTNGFSQYVITDMYVEIADDTFQADSGLTAYAEATTPNLNDNTTYTFSLPGDGTDYPLGSVKLIVEYMTLDESNCDHATNVDFVTATEANLTDSKTGISGNIVLRSDFVLEQVLEVTNTTTLCLNGHELDCYGIIVKDGGSLTLCGGNAVVGSNNKAASGTVINSDHTKNEGAAIYFDSTGTLSLEGNLDLSESTGGIYLKSGKTIESLALSYGQISPTNDMIYVVKEDVGDGDDDYNLIMKGNTYLEQAKAYIAGTAFYRNYTDGIHLATVAARAEDFAVSFNDKTTSDNIHSVVYDGKTHGFDIEIDHDDLRAYYHNDVTKDNYGGLVVTYDVIENSPFHPDAEYFYYDDRLPEDYGSYDVYVHIKHGVSEYFTTTYGTASSSVPPGVKLGTLNITQKVIDDVYVEYLDASGNPVDAEFAYTGNQITPDFKVYYLVYNEKTGEYDKEYIDADEYGAPAGKDIYGANTQVGTKVGTISIESNKNSNLKFSTTSYFNIVKSSDAYLNEANNMNGVATYGDTIQFSVTPTMGGVTLNATTSLYYNVYLYQKGNPTPLGELVYDNQADNGQFILKYETIAKNFTTEGINEVYFKMNADPYFSNIGDDVSFPSMTSDYMEITLLPKEIYGTLNDGQSKSYDGTRDFVGVVTPGKDENAENVVETDDKVTIKATGVLSSADVGPDRIMVIVNTVEITGDDSQYYKLPVGNVSTDGVFVTIRAVDLADANITENHTITVMKGVGTFVVPEFTYIATEGIEVSVPGSIEYNDETYNTYEKIVAHLKTLEVNDFMLMNYTFTLDPAFAHNYEGDTISGKITFIVVDIKFEGIDDAIVVKDEAVYGDVNNFHYDPSKFVANIGTTTTTGAYFLTVTDALGAQVTDLSLLKVGTYNYSVSFTSYDGAYIGSFVTEGTFDIIPRPVTLEWENLTFEYDSTELSPKATITNIVWTDDVSIEVTGGETNVGDYTAVLALAGNDKVNYSLAQETVTYKITPAEAKGLITVSVVDTDGSTALSTGDVLTADISSVTPLGGTVFYHWYRDDVLMSSAVWPTYTISAADAVGTTIRCEVTFSGNTTGTISTVGMDIGDFFFTGSVSISYEDGVLTATVVDTNTDDYTILWNGVANAGNGETYEMDLTDYGRTVTVTVIANHGSGFCGNFNTATTVNAGKPYTPELEVEAGDTCVNVSWTEPFHNGAVLEGYTLTVTDREGNEIYGSPFEFDTSLNSYTVMNLVNNNVYTFNIAVKNAMGTTYSEYLTAVPRSEGDVDTEGDVTTTTTTEEYEDEDGNIITTTVVTEINSADGSIRVTTTTTTVAPDGSTTVQTTMTFTDGNGAVIESSESYKSDADIYDIYYEIAYDEEGSESLLQVTTDDTDAIVLPVTMLQPVVDTDDSTITFITPNATISFDNAALETIFAYANPYSDDVLELIAEYTAPDQMPISVRERLSEAFIMNLTLKLGNVTVTDFDPGYVTVTLPYTKFDTSKNVSVYHVADTGSLTRMSNAEYDIDNKTVTFTATHFSYYAVLEEANRFTDVYVTDYYYDAVQWGVENGITSGSTPTSFNPHAKCTRAEAITMLWKAMGSQQSSSYMPFTDVTANDYYFDSFRWAYGTGISTGTKPTLAGPFDVCTRDQIVTFLWIANGKDVVEEELYFSDVPVGGWYTDAIRWAVSEGVTAGSSATTFSPENVCTRAEIITFLYKCSTL